jgi:hypothetical protein
MSIYQLYATEEPGVVHNVKITLFKIYNFYAFAFESKPIAAYLRINFSDFQLLVYMQLMHTNTLYKSGSRLNSKTVVG